MNKSLGALILLLSFGVANAEDTPYSTVTEVKSWPTKNDIYLSSAHACGGTDVYRYHLSKTDNQQYALLVTALSTTATVSLSYTCASNGYPSISGVRVRKQ